MLLGKKRLQIFKIMSFWSSSNTRGSGAARSAAGVFSEHALLGRHAEQSRVAVQNPGLRLRQQSPKPVVYARVWIRGMYKFGVAP